MSHTMEIQAPSRPPVGSLQPAWFGVLVFLTTVRAWGVTLRLTEGTWAQSQESDQSGRIRRAALQNLSWLFWRQYSQINWLIPLSGFPINV